MFQVNQSSRLTGPCDSCRSDPASQSLHLYRFDLKNHVSHAGFPEAAWLKIWKFKHNRLKKQNLKTHIGSVYFPDVKAFRKELTLFLRGVRKYKPELSALIADNFHILET